MQRVDNDNYGEKQADEPLHVAITDKPANDRPDHSQNDSMPNKWDQRFE